MQIQSDVILWKTRFRIRKKAKKDDDDSCCAVSVEAVV
jgi:hypothetical protein